MAVIKAFWTDLSKYLLDSMNLSHLFFRMVASEQLPNTGCEGDWPKVRGLFWVIKRRGFPNQLDLSKFPAARPATLEEAVQGRGERDGHLLNIW